MKIAILVLMHEYNEQQKQLLKNLSTDFDLYVHLDKKAKIKTSEINIPNVFIYKKEKIFWGSFNMVKATLFLLEKANKNNYDRYILISGADLPLRSNKEISDFFKENKSEYISLSKLPIADWTGTSGGFDRIDYFYANNLDRISCSKLEYIPTKVLNKIFNKILNPLYKKLKKKRRLKINYFGGSQWWNLTGSCVSQILSVVKSNRRFVKSFRYTNCSDEVFFQTVIMNFCNNLNIKTDELRYIDWSTGPEYPRVFDVSDKDMLLTCSNKLFARKFSSSKDNEIIDLINKKNGN